VTGAGWPHPAELDLMVTELGDRAAATWLSEWRFAEVLIGVAWRESVCIAEQSGAVAQRGKAEQS
jgi:hypothetical protein